MNSLKDTNLRAWTSEMPELYDVALVEGRHITDADLKSASPACVVGIDIVDNLMPGVDPVGKEIRWNNFPCTVIGVGKKEGSSLGTSLDNWIIMPLTSYQNQFGAQTDSLRVTIRAGSAGKNQESVDEVRQSMYGRRHCRLYGRTSFAIQTR